VCVLQGIQILDVSNILFVNNICCGSWQWFCHQVETRLLNSFCCVCWIEQILIPGCYYLLMEAEPYSETLCVFNRKGFMWPSKYCRGSFGTNIYLVQGIRKYCFQYFKWWLQEWSLVWNYNTQNSHINSKLYKVMGWKYLLHAFLPVPVSVYGWECYSLWCSYNGGIWKWLFVLNTSVWAAS
jgi:hypothetical protein